MTSPHTQQFVPLAIKAEVMPLFAALVEKVADQGAPCTSAPEMWWTTEETEKEIARRLCFQCPAIEYCFGYALAANETSGVWGGTTPSERSTIHRREVKRRSVARVRQRSAELIVDLGELPRQALEA